MQIAYISQEGKNEDSVGDVYVHYPQLAECGAYPPPISHYRVLDQSHSPSDITALSDMLYT